MAHTYMCPRCSHGRSWVFASKHYGPHARKCKACGHTANGSEFTATARAAKLAALPMFATATP